MTFSDIFLKRHFVCPFCLRRLRWQKGLKKCAHTDCARDLPVQYTDPDMLMAHFPAQVIGWAQHGKTAYLSALTLMLMKMTKIWPRYAWSAATDASQRRVQEVNTNIRRGIMPQATPLGTDECYIMMLREMDPWGGRALLIRDCPGEVFDGMHIPVEQAPFLLRARTVYMFISLPDLLDQGTARSEGRTMDMLMNNYIDTLTRSGVRLRKEERRVIVVLTKGDLIRDLSPELREYLANDVLWAAVNSASPERMIAGTRQDGVGGFMERYLVRMQLAHRAIRRWLERDIMSQNFIRLAETYKIDFRFSITSSTGSPVEANNAMQVTWEPRRVLDPFFWGLELDRLSSPWPWARLVGASRGNVVSAAHRPEGQQEPLHGAPDTLGR